MELELRSYRADPSDRRFRRLYDVARPWLRGVAISTVSKYATSLSVSGSVDDVLNAGAMALSVSARRYVFFCPICGDAYVNRADLTSHMKDTHHRRGVALVSLTNFSRTSAYLAMRRTARRLSRPEILDPDATEDRVEFDAEDRLLLEIMIGRFRARLSASSRAKLESVLLNVTSVDAEVVEDLRREMGLYIGVIVDRVPFKESQMNHEPNWSILNVRTLKESAHEVLELETEERTLRDAYADLEKQIKESKRELKFKCNNCESLIDDVIPKCWACGSVFNDPATAEDELLVDAELSARAIKLGISVEGLGSDEILKAIEAVETKTRNSRQNVDLLTIESAKLNERMTELMPDGWSKKASKHYTSYFDSDRTRRIAIFHRGLKLQFSIDDGFLDGFVELEFFNPEQRKIKHYGRVNYEYTGDAAKYALDLSRRVFEKYA